MQRREYLATFGLLTLAGCTGQSGDPGVRGDGESTDSRTPTETPQEVTETLTPTESREPASFELVNVDAPSEAEIGEMVSYSYTVKNTGEKAGTFSTTIQSKISGEEFSRDSEPWTSRIAPGEEVTLSSQEYTIRFMTELTIKIVEFDRTFKVQFVSRKAEFGESFRNQDGIIISVERVEFKNTYTWQGSSGNTYEEEPSEGDKWAFVYVRAENNAGSPEFAPFAFDFVVLSGNSQYDRTYASKDEGKYEGGEIQPGVIREGWILFEIPEQLGLDDLRVVWSESYFNGDVAVYWSQSGS